MAIYVVGISAPSELWSKMEIENIVRANNSFALELFRQVSGSQEENVILAPYSASEAFALVLVGARRKTQTQISNVLRFPADPNSVAPAMDELRGLLSITDAVEEIDLNIVRGLWVDNSLNLLDGFVNHLKRFYNASPNRVDFKGDPSQAQQFINSWVEEQTNAKIRNLIREDSLNPLTRLLLVTATYFKGTWAKEFDINETRDSQFWRTPDQSINVPFMTQQDQFPYAENTHCQILELPYADDRLSMIFFLPKEKDGLTTFENLMTISALEQWMQLLNATMVRVSLPRFQLESRIDLSQTLVNMGMTEAFGIQADFSGVSDSEDLHLASILHQTLIEVSEEGTQAVGSTGVLMEGRSLRPQRLTTFDADHPFFFIIKENKTDSILFLGRLNDPKV